ncbi:MAG: M18 family aminopeptidase [Firmicutes bacterium HGW-Firmicutes-1]|jgi:aspartyl aminopeptidase|nr:MAG: M18 family aminopeptidase [Firmicutes bacterium HGW-Firmicutes-1]
MENMVVADFLEFLEGATTPYQTVLECEKRLVKAGFVRLNMEESWSMTPKGRYYVIPYDSIIIAFTVANEMHNLDRIKVIASHNDSPCFKIKSNPEMLDGNILKLNTEVYGGPILNTWMDRTLSIAGKVGLRSEDIFKPIVKYVDMKKTIVTIPNIAIHMNRKVNEGIELNKQVDLLPVLGLWDKEKDKSGFLIQLISDAVGVQPSEVLDFDLYLYLAEKGAVIGVDEGLISAPRLDNLAMVYTSIEALMKSNNKSGIQMAVCFNNEEIGSTTIEGADSSLLSIIIQRIMAAFNRSTEQYYRMLNNSFMISADAAHGTHPNAPQKGDPTNEVRLNEGITIKSSAKKSYATDCESAAVFLQLCERAEIKVQRFANRSDMIGGMTLGPVVSKYLPIRTVDVGLPMWAMHSAREVIGLKDFVDSLKVFETFYNS